MARARRPTPAKDIVEEVLGRIKDGGGLRGREDGEGKDIFEAWEKAAGPRAARHTQPFSLRKGVLTVGVDDSAWLYQLTIEKRRLMGALTESLKEDIIDIKFRIK